MFDCYYDEYSHAVHVELVPAGQTHDLAYAVDVLLKADGALDLPAHVFLPLTGTLLMLASARWGLRGYGQRCVNRL